MVALQSTLQPLLPTARELNILSFIPWLFFLSSHLPHLGTWWRCSLSGLPLAGGGVTLRELPVYRLRKKQITVSFTHQALTLPHSAHLWTKQSQGAQSDRKGMKPTTEATAQTTVLLFCLRIEWCQIHDFRDWPRWCGWLYGFSCTLTCHVLEEQRL